jgi:hypothetical protein
MKKYFGIFMIILYGLIVAEVATSSDPCAEYKSFLGQKRNV